MENAIVKILSRIDPNNLPTIPKILVDFMDAVQRQDVSIETLSKIIEKDPAISSSILATTHSPLYRQWGEVTNLKKMVVMLGLTAVKTLVMAKAIQQFFAGIPKNQHSHLEVIWYHSLTSAQIARNLAQLTAYEFADEAYLAGLTHRLGQLILLKGFPDEYPRFLEEYPNGDIEQEKAWFGAPHYEVGAYVIRSWKLQSFLADAVKFQGDPLEALQDSARIVKILNLACKLSSIDEENQYFIYGQANRLFGLNQELVASMLDETRYLAEQTADNLGIHIKKTAANALINKTTPEEREAIQALLGERVKKVALTAAIQTPLHNTTELSKLVSTLRRDMSVLFGLPAVLLFVYQGDSHSLDAIIDEQQDRAVASTLSINLDTEVSLLTKAWRSGRILHSFNLNKTNPETQLDRQICQLMNCDDMIVFPLVQGGQVLGVITAGLKRSDVKRIKLNLDFISIFVGEATKILQTLQTVSVDSPTTLNDIQTNYALYARKLGHEINNPLSIINNYLYLLSLKLGTEHADQIRIIQEEIERVSNITLSLSDLTLASVKTLNSVVDLNSLIMDLVRLFEAGIFKTPVITTRLNLDNNLIKISINKDKLKQILTNLIKNAVEAMPSGGEIILSTKACVGLGGKQAFEVQVQDNGPGLPEAVLLDLFKPVSSHKGKQSAGLGLVICKSLVDELKGSIHCESVPGVGTIFHIILPREF